MNYELLNSFCLLWQYYLHNKTHKHFYALNPKKKKSKTKNHIKHYTKRKKALNITRKSIKPLTQHL